jgi:hypothetical protein
MTKNNILIITHGFYPELSPRSFRATELAKEFARQGHDITVMAPFREGTEKFANENGIKFKSLGQLKWQIFNFKSLGFVGRLYNKIVNRFLPLLFEYPMMELFFKIRKAIKEEKNQYDLLISIAVPYPVHWGVASIWHKSESNIATKWVADCGDPYMYSMHDTFRKPFYFHFLENLFLENANYIAVPFEEMKLQFNQRYTNKFVVIPQGFKFVEYELAIYKQTDKINFAYSGTIMPGKRDPFELIDYLEMKGVNYNFIVYTHQKHLFDRYKHLLNYKIFIKDYIPRVQLIFELSKMDFLVNVNTASKNGIINAIPSKLIDYYFVKRPVLSYEYGSLPKVIIDSFLQGNFEQKFQFKNIEKYRVENVVNQFLNLI